MVATVGEIDSVGLRATPVDEVGGTDRRQTARQIRRSLAPLARLGLSAAVALALFDQPVPAPLKLFLEIDVLADVAFGLTTVLSSSMLVRWMGSRLVVPVPLLLVSLVPG